MGSDLHRVSRIHRRKAQRIRATILSCWAYDGYARRRTAAAAPTRMTAPFPSATVRYMTIRRQITLLRAELAAVAATFLLFSTLHLGARIGPLSDVLNLDGGIAEAILGVGALVAFIATFIRPASAWTWGVVANGVATAGVLLGIFATRGGTTELNFVYHRLVLAVVAISLVMLVLARAATRRRHSSIR